jgi:3-methyladenine DNA glycosylase AlkD
MLEYERCIAGIKAFLPFVDNWGVCDGLRPKCFSDNKESLIGEIFTWFESEQTYTVRFAIEMLMLHFLGDSFRPEYPEAVSRVRSGEYYLDMMVAWYFATALSERYEEVLPYLTEKRLSVWVHNKTISKATESYRISSDKKEYLKSLRIKERIANEKHCKKSFS